MTHATLKATVAAIALTAGAAWAQDTATSTDMNTDTDVSESVENAAESTGEEIEQTANDAAEATEDAAEDTGDALAEAGDEVEDAAEDTADAADEAADEVASETAEATDEMDADADADATAEAEAESGDTEEMTAEAESDTSGAMVNSFAGMTAADLMGQSVVGATGEEVGEVDYLVRNGADVAAVIGVGGFLGLGEHTVAVPLSELTQGAEGTLMLNQMTEEELEAMPEVDESTVERLEDDAPIDSAS